MGETQLASAAEGLQKRDVAMSLAMPFYPIERPWTAERLLLPSQVDCEAYVAALSREALAGAEDFADCRVPAVYVGGGIAGHVADASLGELLRDVRKSYDLACADGSPAEITMRVYPGMVSAATTDACRIGHVTRLEFDYATSSASEARELGRFMGPEVMNVSKTVLGPSCRTDLAFDLFWGLPGQTERSAVESVEAVLGFRACAVNLRAFALDPASKLAAERAAHDADWLAAPLHRLPGEEERAAIAAAMGERLAREGMREYLPGMWALPGHESRWAQMHAAKSDVLGFGLGASTRFEGVCARNTGDLATYLRFSDDPEKVIVQTHRE